MHVWADIEDSNGDKIGFGALDTVASPQFVKRLSKAGTFSFSVHVNDPNLAYFLETDGTTGSIRLLRKIAKLRAPLGTSIKTLGGGIIENVTYDADRKQVSVSGSTLLRELAYRRKFGLFADLETDTPDVFFWNGSSYVTVTPATDVSLLELDSFLFVGYDFPFNLINVDMGATVNGVADNEGSWGFSVEGADPIGGGWREPVVIDGTNVGGAPFAQDGDIEFIRPANWVKVTVNGLSRYWMRFDPSQDLTANIRFADIDITIISVIANDIEQLIDDYNADAPPTPPVWTVDTVDWYDGTVKGTVRTWAGETYLEILTKISEQTGEDFREGDGNDGREIEWLRTDIDDTLFLVAQEPNDVNAPINDNTAYIMSLEDEYDSHEIINRVYVGGAGNGDVQLDFSDSDRTVPLGYTMDSAFKYLEHDDSIAAWGRIDGFIQEPDIGSADGSGSSDRDASNALFDAALATLGKYAQPLRAYRLTITGLNRVVDVGTEVNIDYRRVASGAVVWSVRGAFRILETSNQVGTNGLYTSGLMIANVTRFPQTDGAIMARQIRKFLDYKRHPQGVSFNSVR